jgi:hypothetical protein
MGKINPAILRKVKLQSDKIKKLANADKTILSLFDYSGNWSDPYRKAGYHVIQIDIKRGHDIFQLMSDVMQDQVEAKAQGFQYVVYGILAAPPCTDFAASGAWTWKVKERMPAKYDNPRTWYFENTIEHSVAMVLATLELISQLKPTEFWTLENPIGRINKLVPEIGQPKYFQPYWYGDPYSKKTALYGKFNMPEPTNIVNPTMGSMITTKLSSRQQEKRSETPKGFARAFFEANQ